MLYTLSTEILNSFKCIGPSYEGKTNIDRRIFSEKMHCYYLIYERNCFSKSLSEVKNKQNQNVIFLLRFSWSNCENFFSFFDFYFRSEG